MGFRRKQRREDVRVDLTPMVDVVFLLLIFFMVSTTFVESPGLDIELPTASTQQQHKPRQLRAYLTAEGTLYLGEQQLPIARLQQRLQQAVQGSPKPAFVVVADKRTPHGKVVEVMDAARQAGWQQLSISTRSDGTGRP